MRQRSAPPSILTDRIPFGLEPHDLDADGQVDVLVTLMDPGIFKAIGWLLSALVTQSVPMNLKIQRMNDGAFLDSSMASCKIRSQTPGEGEHQTSFPAIRIGDINGGGRAYLLVQNGDDELHLYEGIKESDLFADRQELEIAVPKAEYIWLEDLNNDGKQEEIPHHPSASEPNKVTVLFSQ